MSKNVVFMHAIGYREEYRYGKESWAKWCENNDVEFVFLDEEVRPVSEMFPNYQRYYMFDLLDASGIEYDRVLTVDADTLIHPNAPNLFEETKSDILYMVHDDGSYDWILRGMEHYRDEMSNEFGDIWFDFGGYGNSGFQLLGKEHKEFFKSMVELWDNYGELIMDISNKYGIGKEQTIWNYMIRKHDIKWQLLPYEWNMTNMMKKEILSDNFAFTRVGWVYHFNGIPDKENGSVARWMRETQLHLENQ